MRLSFLLLSSVLAGGAYSSFCFDCEDAAAAAVSCRDGFDTTCICQARAPFMSAITSCILATRSFGSCTGNELATESSWYSSECSLYSVLGISSSAFATTTRGSTPSFASGTATRTTAFATGSSAFYTRTSTYSYSYPTYSYNNAVRKTVQVGAIVGGVIGGLALLCIIGALITLCCCISKRNKRNKNPPPVASNAAVGAAPMGQAAGYGGYPPQQVNSQYYGQPVPPYQAGGYQPAPYNAQQDYYAKVPDTSTSGATGISPVGTPFPQAGGTPSTAFVSPVGTHGPVSPPSAVDRDVISAQSTPQQAAAHPAVPQQAHIGAAPGTMAQLP